MLERTNEGRTEAKLKGIKFGRKRTVDREKIISLYRSGVGATEVAKQTGIGRSTVYKLLKENNHPWVIPVKSKAGSYLSV